MDNSPKQQKTNPGDTQEQTSDTGFHENLAHNTIFTDHESSPLETPENGETSEARSRTMTEGFSVPLRALRKISESRTQKF